MAIMKKIEFKEVTQKPQEVKGVDNPTEVRYGWMPFKSVNLYNGDGTIYYRIQPEESPYHREIPKNQLIPFETFSYTVRVPDTGERAPGGGSYFYETETKTAFECATTLLVGYSGRGYTVLNSLQGLSQTDAERIFRIVQPFDYKLGELVGELSFAEERIEATEPIDFSDKVGEEYFVEPLRNEREREIARKLALEMIEGAQTAQDFALNILDETEKSLVAVAAGRKEGKRGADPLDRYLEREMDKALPNMYGKDADLQKVAEKVDFLVDREQTREMREENERLKAEIEELRAKRDMPAPFKVGDTVTANGQTGTVESKPGGRYKVRFDGGETQMFDRSELT